MEGAASRASATSDSIKGSPNPLVASTRAREKTLNTFFDTFNGVSIISGDFLENTGFPRERERHVAKFRVARNIQDILNVELIFVVDN